MAPARYRRFRLPENQGTAAELLARCASQAAVKCAVETFGQKPCGAFLSSQRICTIQEEGKKFFLFQMFPEAPAAPPTSAATPPSVAAAGDSKNPEFQSGSESGAEAETGLQVAIGANSFAVDFNNALTSILGHTSLLLNKMEPNNPWRNSLLEVEKSAAKAAEIANDLAAFSRQEKEVKTQGTGNLNQLLQRNVDAFRGTKLNKEIDWTMQPERKLYMAKFEEAKLQQALAEIIQNAIEAVGPVGRIIITTKNIELTQPTQDRNAQLAAGTYVCAEIADNGSGIEPDVMPRLFEPFFTTKRGSKRPWVGAWFMASCPTRAARWRYPASRERGTSVRIYLSDREAIGERTTAAPSATCDLNGNQTVLMVDDEDLLLSMGQTVLSAYGYKVLTANTVTKSPRDHQQRRTSNRRSYHRPCDA